ncbi:MAG TPA: hypothetical protein VIM56_14650 [Rhizomicrobium sp.]
MLKKLKARHSGHVEIKKKAANVRRRGRRQEFSCRRKADGAKSIRFEKSAYGIANVGVVVDDANALFRRVRHRVLSAEERSGRYGKWLGRNLAIGSFPYAPAARLPTPMLLVLQSPCFGFEIACYAVEELRIGVKIRRFGVVSQNLRQIKKLRPFHRNPPFRHT